MRLPPTAVSSSTRPSGSARISPTIAASAPSGWAVSSASAPSAARGRDDRDELSLVRDVERVDAEDLARPGHFRPDGNRALVEDDGQLRGGGELVEGGREAAARRVSEEPELLAELHERRCELVNGDRVRADIRLERELAARQHHGHAVIADRAGDEDSVSFADPVRTELEA